MSTLLIKMIDDLKPMLETIGQKSEMESTKTELIATNDKIGYEFIIGGSHKVNVLRSVIESWIEIEFSLGHDIPDIYCKALDICWYQQIQSRKIMVREDDDDEVFIY